MKLAAPPARPRPTAALLLLCMGCASPAAGRATSGDGTWRLLASTLINWEFHGVEPEDGRITFISDWQLGDHGSAEKKSRGVGDAERFRVIDGQLTWVEESFEWSFDAPDPTDRRTYTFTWEDGTRESFFDATVSKDAVDIGTDSTGFVAYALRRPL